MKWIFRAFALAALMASLSLSASPAQAGGECGVAAVHRSATDEITFYAPNGPNKFVQMWVYAENIQVRVPNAQIHDASTWDYPNKPNIVKFTMQRIDQTQPGDVFVSLWDECGNAAQASFELGRTYNVGPYEIPDPQPIPANIPPLRLSSCRVDFDRLPNGSAVLISAGTNTKFSQVQTSSDNFLTNVAGAKVDGTIPAWEYAVWNFEKPRSLALVYTDQVDANQPARTSITVTDSCGQSHRFETGTGKAT